MTEPRPGSSLSTSWTALGSVRQVLVALVDAIEGAAHASVLTFEHGEFVSLVSTQPSLDTMLLGLDSPAGRAFAVGRIVRIPSTHRCNEFPRHAAVLEAFGLHSLGAFPLRGVRSAVIGVLVVTSYDHHGLGTNDLKTARRTAERLAALITDGHTDQP